MNITNKKLAQMPLKNIRRLLLVVFLAACVCVLVEHGTAQKTGSAFSPVIPKVWDDREMADLELPLADAANSPKQVSADYYYRIPVRPIYKSYPAYVPGKEPAGYQEWLKQQEPEVEVFDPAKLKTEADWIKAGEAVFDAPIFYNAVTRATDLADPAWYAVTGARAAKDGV